MIGNKTMANTLVMGMLHQPMRGLAKFGGMSRRQLEALIMMFNGHMLKGIGRFLTKEKTEKQPSDADNKPKAEGNAA
jgi:hypothetical protein